MLITGAAGFIGHAVAKALLSEGREVVGVDNLNAYYDPALKHARLARLREHEAFSFHKLELADESGMQALFEAREFPQVVHLAAQAGVRYSIEAPQQYISSNVIGLTVLLECCVRHNVEHLLYASSSSVYGDTEKTPFTEEDAADRPRSVYAATKRAGELLAYSYARIHGLPSTGIRYFTVYGPWGRPDMAPMIFAQQLCEGKALKVFGDGRQRRAFTCIDDVVRGTLAILEAGRPGGTPPAALYNLGAGEDVELLEFIRLLADRLGSEAQFDFEPEPPGEMRVTVPNMSAMQRDFSFAPNVTLEEGLSRFALWYREHYG
ncbi:MAG: SDR family NAD(P)-dependent oxidoreductase [Gammaproteobacteria bacterium]|nr:SDR family NAD(P)-dependent oxidoreductase [Gammaproteobacteria bacterium]MXW46952.1 SDR family NAD(P)-dependent oxidoreductase [Gammaproteobacteria bacterium]MYD02843.1 SDR family NAD(P)-dependent oxidoreductase [Gammaproteobacteria bacterium]MYI24420.1 SDR family NAD(P)-dependent oxidoreductase [Gammaproteobacteria bacterium]